VKAGLTLDAIQAALGGIVIVERNLVATRIDLGAGGGVISVQVILDPTAPNGIRVRCIEARLATAERHVRKLLKLPPSAANDNSNGAPTTFGVNPFDCAGHPGLLGGVPNGS